MTRIEMRRYCEKVVMDATAGKKMSPYGYMRTINDLLNEVWKWWKKLPIYEQRRIIAEGANPATVFKLHQMVGKRLKAEREARDRKLYVRFLRWVSFGRYK